MRRPIYYTPKGGDRTYEIEVVEEDNGHVTFYVGGMPILYLDPTMRCLRLVPNDIHLELGLTFTGATNCVKVVRDKTR